MKDGFVKVGAVTPDLRVADCEYNRERMVEVTKEASELGVKLLVFPELGLTGYTCNDLFLQDPLLRGAERELGVLAKETRTYDMVLVVGLPIMHNGRLYNVAAVLNHGQILGLVPKSFVPSYSEFYEGRQFAGASDVMGTHYFDMLDLEVTFGTKQIFRCKELRSFAFAIEICEDLWMPVPPSSYHTMAGATVIVNLSASDETTGKAKYRRELVKGQSARTVSGYIYADAGDGESTTDLVFAGHDLIVENGSILAESARFQKQLILSELDIEKLVNERRRMTTLQMSQCPEKDGYVFTEFDLSADGETVFSRTYERTPFVPDVKEDRDYRCHEILSIQAMGLKKRLSHTHAEKVVIGLSGGLDSTLALLVTVHAFDRLKIPRENIICVTMPCFGTTNRTYENAINLARELGASLREIPIETAVRLHFTDIGHDIDVHDITYENGQARERTQILMNIANMVGGLVIGTGDLSELALGWATYNGDHMSMYGVNCSVPKTLVRYLVLFFADTCQNDKLQKVLYDVLDTPVSPELLPPKNGEMIQYTEDLIGPYELHDFFLYYTIRRGFTPAKIRYLAEYAFKNVYDAFIIEKWMQVFYKRFFAQQFKRSCLPDGPKVGTVTLSPRGDWRMPSDASSAAWLESIGKE